MNKQEIIKTLKEKSTELGSLSKNIAKSPAMKVEGTLIRRFVNGKSRLYLKKGNSDTYLSLNNKKQISLLATKGYAIRMDRASKLEKEQMDRCIKVLESKVNEKGEDMADVDLVHGRLPEYMRENAAPSLITDEAYAAKWQAEKYNNRWKKGKNILETSRGEKVRSKSEWIIANMLAEAGVPYRYEEIVPVSAQFGVFVYPDFTVLNKRTRQVFYWEHCGMMGDNEYMQSFMPKMSDYYNFGFFPGKNLLLTFESRDFPLDTHDVKKVIEEYLL